VWTTWCGPCRAELPHIQKLYDSMKDHLDLQVLTLNWDEDSGLVEPFLKEKGYKFPVVLAYGFLSSSFESGVPQTWIVDSQGRWQSTKWGFGGDNDWEEMVSRK
jgi:thiol-disulfide isomerase/thioredoxin